MFCEICGREIVGKPSRALVEGATLVVCRSCATLGTELPGFPEAPRPRVRAQTQITGLHVPTRPPIEKLPKEVEETDLLDDYSHIVKEGRAKMHFSQEELAFKAKEKVTVIQKIETGKMLPTMRLAKELEHILRIKLVVPKEEEELPASYARPAPRSEATLGDVAMVKRKDEEEIE